MALSAKLQTHVFLMKKLSLFVMTLNYNGPNIDPRGTIKRISRYELMVDPNFAHCKRFVR